MTEALHFIRMNALIVATVCITVSCFFESEVITSVLQLLTWIFLTQFIIERAVRVTRWVQKRKAERRVHP